ncbi:MAG: hypothetical protein JO257_10495 [Deltaproteobacteria bacterium]|nr:hypothetical protein [Deltaproteobacteria bacterium]
MRRLLVLLLLACPVVATADEAKGPHPEGAYGGVQPGHKPEKPRRPPPKGTLTWIGFEPKSGTSEVFLQSVAPFEVAQRVDKGAVVVTLTGVTRLGANTWRPIDTRFFDTPLARVSATRKGKGIEVRIAFKNGKDAKEAAVRSATEADGMYYAYLDFAGGGDTSVPTTADPER